MVNSYLVCHPTIRQPGFDLPWQQWSLLNRFRTEHWHCGACRRKWRLADTDLCPCGETQTMSHIVESCPLTKLNGGLSRLHSADEDAVSWLTSCGSWNAYEKKKCRSLNQLTMTECFEFWVIIRSFNVEKRSILERFCSLLAPLVWVIFNGVNLMILDSLCNTVSYQNMMNLLLISVTINRWR